MIVDTSDAMSCSLAGDSTCMRVSVARHLICLVGVTTVGRLTTRSDKNDNTVFLLVVARCDATPA